MTLPFDLHFFQPVLIYTTFFLFECVLFKYPGWHPQWLLDMFLSIGKH